VVINPTVTATVEAPRSLVNTGIAGLPSSGKGARGKNLEESFFSRAGSAFPGNLTVSARTGLWGASASDFAAVRRRTVAGRARVGAFGEDDGDLRVTRPTECFSDVVEVVVEQVGVCV